jgi:8-oxo-dGTP diphosphatase
MAITGRDDLPTFVMAGLIPAIHVLRAAEKKDVDARDEPGHDGKYVHGWQGRMKLTLVVACALVDADKRVLIAQRPEGKTLPGLWEFPGGKVEAGERPEQTLIRELHEEIGITVKEDCLAPLTFASHAYESFHLLMPLYICRRWDGEVIAREGQALKWVRANKLRDYPMPAADIPLIPHLIDVLM